MEGIFQIFKVVCAIIGTLIGAGFASGQEIYSFFYVYGGLGILGMLISSGLIALITYRVFVIICTNDITNYEAFLECIIDNKNVRRFMNLIVNGALLMTFYVMVAGFGGCLRQQIGVGQFVGNLSLIFCCYILVRKNKGQILNISSFLVPILIGVILFVGLKSFADLEQDAHWLKNWQALGEILVQNLKSVRFQKWTALRMCGIKSSSFKVAWLVKSIFYATYNSILLIPVLITFRANIKNVRAIKCITFFVNLTILVLMFAIFVILIRGGSSVADVEIPVMNIIKIICPQMEKIYGIVILISIFTTALSMYGAFINNVGKNVENTQVIELIVCVFGTFFAQIGFSNLINMLYPVLGFLGIFQIIYIIFNNYCKKNKKLI